MVHTSTFLWNRVYIRYSVSRPFDIAFLGACWDEPVIAILINAGRELYLYAAFDIKPRAIHRDRSASIPAANFCMLLSIDLWRSLLQLQGLRDGINLFDTHKMPRQPIQFSLIVEQFHPLSRTETPVVIKPNTLYHHLVVHHAFNQGDDRAVVTRPLEVRALLIIASTMHLHTIQLIF